VKIVDVRLTGLTGGTVDGGWPQGNKPEEDLNTIVEVLTDEGLVGVGSAMTSKSLVAAGVALLRPYLIGERADEPARVTEKLRQSAFWQGRGGAVEHAISGIDIALWDLMGHICQQPVSRLLGGNYRRRIKPYGSILFDEPGPLRETLHQTVARGFKAIKLGWRPFGRPRMGESPRGHENYEVQAHRVDSPEIPTYFWTIGGRLCDPYGPAPRATENAEREWLHANQGKPRRHGTPGDCRCRVGSAVASPLLSVRDRH
jgi:L-alanine-DL-glutamate epimerase-like enolase superfamily enzyme